MNIQRISAIALAVIGATSSVSFADPAGVTLYGVFDAGVSSTQHQGNTGDGFASTVNPFSPIKPSTVPTANAPVTGVVNGGLQDSRWGIRGTESLGNGTSAIFNLESGINLPTGQLNNNDAAVAAGGTTNAANSSLSGQLFNRQAWVGIADEDYGRLTIGRQYMPIYDILSNYDNVQFGQLLSPLSFSGGLGGGIGVSEDMREDNSLKYSHAINGVNFGGLYRIGGISGHNGARNDFALNLGYEAGAFGVQAAYERLYDGVKAGSSALTSFTPLVSGATALPASGVCPANNQKVTAGAATLCQSVNIPGIVATNVQVYNSVGYMLAAKYNFDGGVTVRGGFSRYDLTNGDLSTAQMGLTQLYGNTIANGPTSNQVLAAGTTASTHIYWLGGDYRMNSTNMVSFGGYSVQSDAQAGYGKTSGDGGQNEYQAHYYSFLYDHNFSRRTDLYAGAMFANFSYAAGDALATANAYTTNRFFVMGLRHKF